VAVLLMMTAFGTGLPAGQATPTAQRQAAPAAPARLNKLIPTLEQGKPVFGGAIPVGSPGRAKQVVGSAWDFVLLEMGYSGLELELSLQFLLDRQQILEQGTLAPPVVPLVWMPSSGRETNQWLIKHSLDQGAYGIVVPHVNTVEEAQAAIVFSRYVARLSGTARASGSPCRHRSDRADLQRCRRPLRDHDQHRSHRSGRPGRVSVHGDRRSQGDRVRAQGGRPVAAACRSNPPKAAG
jgi:hypothetical protein